DAANIFLAACSVHYRSRSVNEQRSQVGVAPFADAKQTRSAAAGVLLGDQAQPRGELPTVLEDFSITHRGNNRCCREQPDAFHRRDPLARLAGRVDRAQLLLDLLDLAVQVHQFVIERGEQSPPQQSQLITLIFQDL